MLYAAKSYPTNYVHVFNTVSMYRTNETSIPISLSSAKARRCNHVIRNNHVMFHFFPSFGVDPSGFSDDRVQHVQLYGWLRPVPFIPVDKVIELPTMRQSAEGSQKA